MLFFTKQSETVSLKPDNEIKLKQKIDISTTMKKR